VSPRARSAPLPDGGGEPPSNARIGEELREIADLLEIRGDSGFKVNAYRRAADSVARAGVDVVAAYRAGERPALPGVGASISERIEELATEGHMAYRQELRAQVPPTLLEWLAIPGVGPRTAGEIWRTLGVATLAELEAAARAGRLRAVRGLSQRTESRVLEGIAEIARRPQRRMRIDEAHAFAARALELVTSLEGVRAATAAGSVRRWRETVGDIDLLIETGDPLAVLQRLRASPAVGSVEAGLRGGSDRASVRLLDGPQLDVMTMPPGATGSYLVHFTGSAEHNVALRHRAREAGWSLSERGLVPLADPGAEPRTFADERELYRFLGLDEIPPELREGRGEVEAAAAGGLPALISRDQLRGDCHSHSDWSDGREPLEMMVESARVDGREYQVLTDHSQSLTIAHGLSPERVEAQRRIIGELNERFATEAAHGETPAGADSGFVLLHGTELEITVDGRLDYEDALLAGFDVVVASLHVGRRQPRAQLMARYELAMRSPHVDIISHPSGRKIGTRSELDLDWERFYRLAAETGTLVEINGSPARLDLDEDRIRAATEAGCRFVIDSDAHDHSEWQNLVWGSAIARRGWVGPGLVANALPRAAFRALMREKPHRV